MIILTKDEVSKIIYCTPAENTDEIFSYYFFKFTNRITQSIIEVVYENLSTTSRYQMFDINTTTFDEEDTGFWTYEIRQWDDNAEEPSPIGPILESGYMYLNPANTYEPTKYDEQDNSFITYNG
jgi:hypothetical protein